MDACIWLIFVILDIFRKLSGRVGTEHIAVSSMVIEWIAIDCVWRFVGCENEDCASIRRIETRFRC